MGARLWQVIPDMDLWVGCLSFLVQIFRSGTDFGAGYEQVVHAVWTRCFTATINMPLR